jgi:hypothetical protein
LVGDVHCVASRASRASVNETHRLGQPHNVLEEVVDSGREQWIGHNGLYLARIETRFERLDCILQPFDRTFERGEARRYRL